MHKYTIAISYHWTFYYDAVKLFQADKLHRTNK